MGVARGWHPVPRRLSAQSLAPRSLFHPPPRRPQPLPEMGTTSSAAPGSSLCPPLPGPGRRAGLPALPHTPAGRGSRASCPGEAAPPRGPSVPSSSLLLPAPTRHLRRDTAPHAGHPGSALPPQPPGEGRSPVPCQACECRAPPSRPGMRLDGGGGRRHPALARPITRAVRQVALACLGLGFF